MTNFRTLIAHSKLLRRKNLEAKSRDWFCFSLRDIFPPSGDFDFEPMFILKLPLSNRCVASGPASSISLLKLSMAVYGQKLDGRPPDERPEQLTPPSFGRDVELGVPCLDAACIVGLN